MLFSFFLQGAFTDQHFDQDLNFHATEEDPVTKKVGFGLLTFLANLLIIFVYIVDYPKKKIFVSIVVMDERLYGASVMVIELLLLQTIKRLIMNIRPKDIGTIISSSPGEDPKMAVNFKDLLEKIFVLDPEKRMTVSQALCHPFITGK